MPTAPRDLRLIGDWRRQRYLDWLCTPTEEREPPTQTALAHELTIDPRVLVNLKRDPDFLRDWETQYRRTVGSPEKQHKVMNALFETATDRTDPRLVPAARAYLEAIDAIKPKKVEVSLNNKPPRELTQEELDDLLAAKAQRTIEERSVG
jgi:hypothetical protein